MSILLKCIASLLMFFVTFEFFRTLDTSVFNGIIRTISKSESVSYRFRKYEVPFRRLNIPFNFFSITFLLAVGGICAKLIYFIAQEAFGLSSVAYIVAMPFIFSGFALVSFFAERKKVMIENGLNDFLIQLKSVLRVNNEVIEALRRIQNNVMEPFKSYVKQMLNEINSGKLPEQALRDFAARVGIEKFSLYVEHLRFCHIYGGDALELTTRTQEVISAVLKEKKKRNRETNDVCNVLYILILIDLFMYKSFLMGNMYYFRVMTKSFVGMLMINMNFISIWVMVLLSKFIRKLDY